MKNTILHVNLQSVHLDATAYKKNIIFKFLENT